jgi:hypothetical protein
MHLGILAYPMRIRTAYYLAVRNALRLPGQQLPLRFVHIFSIRWQNKIRASQGHNAVGYSLVKVNRREQGLVECFVTVFHNYGRRSYFAT